MHLVFDALISVYGSARQVEAELGTRVVWKSMRRTLKKVFPHDPTMRLPSRPMRRHHYLYFRNRYLANPDALAHLSAAHREFAAAQARQIGLLDPEGPGSWTHPDLTRLLYADGKVLTPLFKSGPVTSGRTPRPARHSRAATTQTLACTSREAGWLVHLLGRPCQGRATIPPASGPLRDGLSPPK